MKIKWTNISSGEQGYVMSLKDDGKDFVNTFLAEEAAGFAMEEAQNAVKALQEAQGQNTYELIDDAPVKDEAVEEEKPAPVPVSATKPAKSRTGRKTGKKKAASK